MSKFLIEKYRTLKPYVPGEQPKERRYVKLNTNESPFPPSPKAVARAKEQLEKLMLYPDPDCRALTEAIAKEYGVSPERVIVTNGSDEALDFAFTAYCDERTPAVFPDITYGFYKVFAALNGVSAKEIPLKADFTIEVEDYIRTDGTVFIANPNAPTGLFLPVFEIEKIVAANSKRVVVVDEAYVDFGGESCIPLTEKYDNLLVVQTFSKSRSMAGARLGFAVGSKSLVEDLQKIRYSTNPYNVNRVTAAAGLGAIEDREYFRANCEKIVSNREYAAKELKRLGFTVTDSAANFLFVKHDKLGGAALYEKLRKRGVLVRHFNQTRIDEYNRITVGSLAEMQTLVKEIESILEEHV